MVGREEIIGAWGPAPGGHITEYLKLHPDGTGALTTVSLTESAEDVFRWSLSDSGEVCFSPVGDHQFYSGLLRRKSKVEVRQERDRKEVIEILTLSFWQEAETISVDGRELKSEAGFSKIEFWRKQSAG